MVTNKLKANFHHTLLHNDKKSIIEAKQQLTPINQSESRVRGPFFQLTHQALNATQGQASLFHTKTCSRRLWSQFVEIIEMAESNSFMALS